ncbi:MAG: hypothetical protein AB1716_04975 [Planctomycetota bacterium]
MRSLPAPRRTALSVLPVILIAAAAVGADDKPRRGAIAPDIVNPRNEYLVWGDYRVEVNQYGGLGRDWPWQFRQEQIALLRKRAAENKKPPNTIRAILLICPIVEATAYKREGNEEKVVGTRLSKMTSDEIKWAIEQWREQEEYVWLCSRGEAWMRTDIKVVDEPLKVKADENFGFFSGPKVEFLDKYLPFERGEYDSYNSLYSDRDLNAGPWGGTMGAVAGLRGMGTSDNIWIARGPEADEQTGFVFWHEFLNQCCSTTSNILPYPPNEDLWNMYCWEVTGHRRDPINAWPGWTNHRDMMKSVIRPTMWRRWRVTAPYRTPAVGRWILFGPKTKAEATADLPRTLSVAPVAGRDAGPTEGRLVEMEMGKFTHFNVYDAMGGGEAPPPQGTYYLRTYVASEKPQEVHIYAGGDEAFQVWLNGVKVRDGYGWNYSNDDRKLFEQVTYASLEQGVNTLVFVLPNTDRVTEMRLRLGKPDGSGELPEGVRIFAQQEKEAPLPLQEPLVRDFAQPKFFKWADVGDDPWLSLPRLDEQALRELTGIASLNIRTDGEVRSHKNEKGEHEFDYVACQHIFLDVPKDAVASPWIAEPAEDNAALNNDFDFNWKAAAWLRVPKRPGPEKDVLLVRNDVAEPMLHVLKTKGRAGQDSLVGWVLVERKLCYVALCDLDLDEKDPPSTELGLLRATLQVIEPPAAREAKGR